jgi:hypothetical protein
MLSSFGAVDGMTGYVLVVVTTMGSLGGGGFVRLAEVTKRRVGASTSVVVDLSPPLPTASTSTLETSPLCDTMRTNTAVYVATLECPVILELWHGFGPRC